jgi:hypothetical protein
MARRTAPPTSRAARRASAEQGRPHIQPVAHAPLPFQIHAFAASVLFVTAAGRVGQAQAWEAGR